MSKQGKGTRQIGRERESLKESDKQGITQKLIKPRAFMVTEK